MEVNIHEAKTHLSRLLERVADGEEDLIMRSNVVNSDGRVGNLPFPMISTTHYPPKSKMASIVKAIIDTQVFLWMAASLEKLSKRARAACDFGRTANALFG